MSAADMKNWPRSSVSMFKNPLLVRGINLWTPKRMLNCVINTLQSLAAMEKVEWVSRADWMAEKPTSASALKIPVTNVICALQTFSNPCFDKAECSQMAREMQSEHMTCENWPDIKYNFLIGGDGRVYEGRGWYAQPTLPARYQQLANDAIFIGFIGDLRGKDPDPKMLKARDDIIKTGFKHHYIHIKFLEFLTLVDCSKPYGLIGD